MLRSHPAVSVLAALYFATLASFAFVPALGGSRYSAVGSFLWFVPVGILLLLLLGTRRWWSALAFGMLGAAWVEAAQSIWMPIGYASAWDAVAGSAGVVVGLWGAIGGLLFLRSMRSHGTPRIIAQARRSEIPRAD